MPGPITVRLSTLRPAYVAHPDSPPGWSRTGDISRYGMGLEFDCPAHLERTCKVRVWFAKPHDGGTPAPVAEGETLYRHFGAVLPGKPDALDGRFEALTLDPRVDVPGCFSGYICDGDLCILRDFSRGEGEL